MDFLHRHIEALVFCSSDPLGLEEIQKCLSEMFESDIPVEHLEEALQALQEQYQSDTHAFSLEKIAGGYQFLTKPAYQTSIAILQKHQSQKRLSTAQLETLSIIAYKQPVTKSEIEQIRGVNCDYSVQKLLEKSLVAIKGKSEGIGRPLLYGTSPKFMEYFGINDLSDLPQPKDFKPEENEIGDQKE
ncbi:segregation and condensation protein B [Cyclobacterium xiamenense]|uniref:Segregation and condensation protein B n=1 Tax=Cyclobacterium xiamenense TaxID=1297121 RepID=A0A1H6XPA4_9BACT|nr:SMC-Scp complex subunit ScpB [Cyclobacterium xiamenense]SEJ30908.1 segregation and condensation protein B [Cyclobacterium xiamenense]